jgi:hypothetical protein
VSITFDCPCGKSLRVGDEHAGRRVKCPACGATVLVPKPPPQFEVVNEEEEPEFEIAEDQPPESRRARHAKQSTSSDDDDEPRPRKEKPDRDGDDDEPRPRKKKKRRSRPLPEDQDDYRGRGNSDLTAIDLCLCIFCPGIGCIVGLVRLITGSGEGGKMVGLSLLFAVIWNVLRFALVAATK